MNKVRFFGRKLKVKLKNILYPFIGFKPISCNYFPKEVLSIYLPKNPVMLDCGAHDGTDSIELIKTLGGTIYAVEAIPNVYRKLLQNTKKIDSIKCFNIALSNNTGNTKFYVSEGNSGASSSLLIPKKHLIDHPEITFDENIEVPCDTLDNWAQKNNIDKIDFMWLDMQGAEKLMLEASNKIIKNVKAIHCEISTKETYVSVPVYDDFLIWMKNLGFRADLSIIRPGDDMGDVLFVRYR